MQEPSVIQSLCCFKTGQRFRDFYDLMFTFIHVTMKCTFHIKFTGLEGKILLYSVLKVVTYCQEKKNQDITMTIDLI